MSKRRIFLLVCGLVIAVAVAGAGAWHLAVQTTSAQDTEGDLEQFRSELEAWYAGLAEAYPSVVDAGGQASTLQLLGDAQQVIPQLTDEDLVVLRDAFAENPALWALPETVQSAFGPGTQASRPETGGAPGDAGPVVNLASSCPTGPGIYWEYVLKGAAILANGVIEAMPDDALSVGGKIFFVGLWVAAEEAALAVEASNQYAADCEGNDDSKLLRSKLPNLDATVASRASQDSLNAIAPGSDKLQEVASKAGLDAIAKTLRNDVALRKVDLEVVQVRGTGKFLIVATDAGRPLDGVVFTSVRIGYENNTPAFRDAKTTVTTLGGGMYLATIDSSSFSACPWCSTNISLVAFQVKHNNGFEEHYGLALFQGSMLKL